MPDVTATTNGWWGIIEDIAHSANNKQADEMSLTAVPIFGKPFVIFNCYQKQTFNKKHKWFTGCCWGKHFAAEVKVPLESQEKCMGERQTVWRGWLSLMQWGAEAGVME